MKPVNLNQYRKTKARADKKVRADENAVRYGQSKSERSKSAKENRVLRDRLEQHKLDNDD